MTTSGNPDGNYSEHSGNGQSRLPRHHELTINPTFRVLQKEVQVNMKALLRKIRQILRDRKARRIFTRLVSTVAAIVVFVTTYALVLPAITMESEAACGIEAHQHDQSCYTDVLVCEIPESPGQFSL